MATRKGFLGTGGAAIGGAALAGSWSSAITGVPNGTVVEGAFDPRFDGDLFYFQFAGEGPGGFLQTVQGGEPSADVVTEKLGPDHIARKHIGGVKYEDITVTCAIGLSKGFYDWIKSSFDRTFESRRGTIIAVDRKLVATSAADFTDAFITEIAFPALDASSKDPAFTTISFSPASTTYKPVQGKIPVGTAPKPPKTTFKLTVDGVDTSRVAKIEAITIKQKVTENAVGEVRDYEQEITSLAFWLEEEPKSIQTWVDWFEDFVVAGDNGQDKERSGKLDLFDPGRSQPLATLTFQNLGIFGLTPESVDTSAGTIRRVKAELYCESISFSYGKSWT